jgi:hypothetical protein
MDDVHDRADGAPRSSQRRRLHAVPRAGLAGRLPFGLNLRVRQFGG